MTSTSTPDEILLKVFGDPATYADPFPLYRELRENWRVAHAEIAGMWVLTRFEDCRAVLRDPRCGAPEVPALTCDRFTRNGLVRVPLA